MDVKLDNLLLTLNENYGMTYERAAAEYELDIFEGTAQGENIPHAVVNNCYHKC